MMTHTSKIRVPFDSATLRAVVPGLMLAVATILFGFFLGVIFGLNEEAITNRLSASAALVRDTVYRGDDAPITAVLDKSWRYMQRAHLHAGSLGVAAAVLMLIVVALGVQTRVAQLVSLALGVGSLGYSVFWLVAGFLAPGLGSTGAARESLSWLAIPSSGLMVAGTVAVMALLVQSRWLEVRTRA